MSMLLVCFCSGITETATGYSASLMRVDEKTVRVYDRLTAEALRCLLEQTGFTEPLFLSDSVKSYKPSGGIAGQRAASGGVHVVLPFLSRDQPVDVQVLKGYSEKLGTYSLSSFHEQVMKRVASYLDVKVEDFRFTCSSSESAVGDNGSHLQRRIHRPLPIYTSTALQIGLMDNPNVPR